jgi:hypothetical protein
MSIETLSTIQPFIAPGRRLTYSISPMVAPDVPQEIYSEPELLEMFLEGENPLGCIRGVMWMMAFNAGFFLLGFLIWQFWKYL